MADSEQHPLPTLFSFLRQYRFAVLLAALLLLFFYGIFVELFATHLEPVVARVTIGSIITVMLFSSVLSVSKSRKSFRNAMILGVPAIVSELLDLYYFDQHLIQIVSHVLTSVFLGYVILVLLRFIFASKRVTPNTIFASLCAYLLLGTFWAMVYSLLATCQPNAFYYSLLSNETSNSSEGDSETSNSEIVGSMRLGGVPAGLEFYFSFVTMTTLGYGDIVPVSAAARGLATLQAVVGQMYLAVLVARLVGLHVAGSVNRKE
jgi:hypothetical protein